MIREQARKQEKLWIQRYISEGIQLANTLLINTQLNDNPRTEVREYQVITAKEAMMRLGVAGDTFQYMVRKQRIRKIILPGRKYGVYSPVEIDELAGKITSCVQECKEDKSKQTFRAARPEDAKGMYNLYQHIMEQSGSYSIPHEKLIPLLSIPNSEIGHVLIRNDRIVGYFTIIPLYHDELMQRMRGEITISQIKPEKLASFEPGIPIDCFIWQVMVEPDQKYAAAYLIGKILDFFHTLGKRGVEIEGIYTIASSLEGINLCRKLGMQLMNLPNVRPNSMPFEMKIQEHFNWLTKNYIWAINSYKNITP